MTDLSDVIQRIAHEINPLYDLEGIDFYKLYGRPTEESSEEHYGRIIVYEMDNVFKYITGVIKPVVRGIATGAIIGAGVSAVSGMNFEESTTMGMLVMGFIDPWQFIIRMEIRYAMTQLGKYPPKQ